MKKFKKPLLFALCLLPIAIVAGIYTGIYSIDTYSEETLALVAEQLGSTDILIVVTAMQTVGYALICGFFGYIFANKVGLWKTIRFEKKPLAIALVLGVICGVIYSLDYWVFGGMIDGIQLAHQAGMTFSGVLSAVLYGGIIEEVMLRLFFMSLIVFVIRKLFCRKCDKEHIPTSVFVIANIIAAVLFAALHLPATAVTFGGLTVLLVVRCFLMNGAFGIAFGWLYRKFGIHYAMIAHAFFHIMSKLIWLIFA